MSIGTLLAIVHNEADAPKLLDFALPFAARHGSHLIGLHAEALPVVLATPMEGPYLTLADELETQAKERHQRLRDMFESRTKRESLSAEWRGFDSVSGDSAISGIDSARSSDLVLVVQNDPNGVTSSADVEALLFHSGRPCSSFRTPIRARESRSARPSSPGTAARRPRVQPSTRCPCSRRPDR